MNPRPMQTTDQAPCPKCGDRLYVKQPIQQVINTQEFSMIIATHEHGITCRKCDSYFVPGIIPAQAVVVWSLYPAERPPANIELAQVKLT